MLSSESFAALLAPQVAFHLQTQQPPILPPLCALFQQSPDVLKGRPLHAGQQPKEGVLEVSQPVEPLSVAAVDTGCSVIHVWASYLSVSDTSPPLSNDQFARHSKFAIPWSCKVQPVM